MQKLAIVLRFRKPRRPIPITLDEMRLRKANLTVSYGDIIKELGEPCARAYARSITQSSVRAQVTKLSETDSDFKNRFDGVLCYAVLSPEKGPVGYTIEYYKAPGRAA